jgi:hypothetical protein
MILRQQQPHDGDLVKPIVEMLMNFCKNDFTLKVRLHFGVRQSSGALKESPARPPEL